jgi:hypothetical protein
MHEAAELGNYLPLSFKSPKEQEYIEFLWDVSVNYTLLAIAYSSWPLAFAVSITLY